MSEELFWDVLMAVSFFFFFFFFFFYKSTFLWCSINGKSFVFGKCINLFAAQFLLLIAIQPRWAADWGSNRCTYFAPRPRFFFFPALREETTKPPGPDLRLAGRRAGGRPGAASQKARGLAVPCGPAPGICPGRAFYPASFFPQFWAEYRKLAGRRPGIFRADRGHKNYTNKRCWVIRTTRAGFFFFEANRR